MLSARSAAPPTVTPASTGPPPNRRSDRTTRPRHADSVAALSLPPLPANSISGWNDTARHPVTVRRHVSPPEARPTPEQPLTRETVLVARLPKTAWTDRVEVRRIRMLPGHAAGLHVHNGPVVGSVVAGSVVYQVEGEAQSVLRAGDVFYEPEGARIARFDAGEEGATFLAYFLLRAGQQPAIAVPER